MVKIQLHHLQLTGKTFWACFPIYQMELMLDCLPGLSSLNMLI